MKTRDGMTFREWMDHKNAREARSLVPRDIRRLLGDVPILKGEDRDWYEETRTKFAEALGPKDAISWVFVDDFAYYTSEIMRVRRVKATTIEINMRAIVLDCLAMAKKTRKLKLPRGVTVEVLTDNYLRSLSTRMWVKQKACLDYNDVVGTAFAMSHEAFVDLDRLLSLLQAQRYSVLRELERYDRALARRLIERSETMINKVAEDPLADPHAVDGSISEGAGVKVPTDAGADNPGRAQTAPIEGTPTATDLQNIRQGEDRSPAESELVVAPTIEQQVPLITQSPSIQGDGVPNQGTKEETTT